MSTMKKQESTMPVGTAVRDAKDAFPAPASRLQDLKTSSVVFGVKITVYDIVGQSVLASLLVGISPVVR